MCEIDGIRADNLEWLALDLEGSINRLKAARKKTGYKVKDLEIIDTLIEHAEDVADYARKERGAGQ